MGAWDHRAGSGRVTYITDEDARWWSVYALEDEGLWLVLSDEQIYRDEWL